MQTLIIPHLNKKVASASEIPAILHLEDVPYNQLTHVNWPENYPYKPKVEFAAAHTGDALLLHYRIEEQSVRAVAKADHEHIWEDACVEFFVKLQETDALYYNIECNCTGKLIVAAGEGRENRKPSPAEVMQEIDRWASLGTEPFNTIEEPTAWEVALRLPLETFFLHKIISLEGLTARGNAYKCGDNLPVPHFVIFNPNKTENPDFHRPEFFGQIVFQ